MSFFYLRLRGWAIVSASSCVVKQGILLPATNSPVLVALLQNGSEGSTIEAALTS